MCCGRHLFMIIFHLVIAISYSTLRWLHMVIQHSNLFGLKYSLDLRMLWTLWTLRKITWRLKFCCANCQTYYYEPFLFLFSHFSSIFHLNTMCFSSLDLDHGGVSVELIMLRFSVALLFPFIFITFSIWNNFHLRINIDRCHHTFMGHLIHRNTKDRFNFSVPLAHTILVGCLFCFSSVFRHLQAIHFNFIGFSHRFLPFCITFG